MINASIVVGWAYRWVYRKNKLFDLSDKILNRDNCLFPWFLLKKRLQERGIDLATSDIHPPGQSDIVIYDNMPVTLPTGSAIRKSILLLTENQLIRPDNWQREKHKRFARILTWHDDWIDNIKYFKIYYASAFPSSMNFDLTKKAKLCVLISSHRRSGHPLELYSKRLEAIRWFEQRHPQDFDLYGFGWNRYFFSGPRIIRALNKIKPLTTLLSPLAPAFPSWQGAVENKRSVMERYKFAICYENARDIPGYITEKIWDCFLAGCVPIYWGAGNIEQYIPRECFIDKTEFDDYKSLYGFIKNMSDSRYLEYLQNIQRFLHSEQARLFSPQNFADTLLKHITIPSPAMTSS